MQTGTPDLEKGKGFVNSRVTEDKRVNGFKPGRQEGTAV